MSHALYLLNSFSAARAVNNKRDGGGRLVGEYTKRRCRTAGSPWRKRRSETSEKTKPGETKVACQDGAEELGGQGAKPSGEKDQGGGLARGDDHPAEKEGTLLDQVRLTKENFAQAFTCCLFQGGEQS